MDNRRKETAPGYRIKAVIDVGSTSIRMAVGQINEDGTHAQLDSLSQSVSIGSDTFSCGVISHETTERCVGVLKNFKRVIGEYGVSGDEDIRAVATSAVSEAGNRSDFLDRLYMATGIDVEVIDGSEVNRLTFLALKPLLDSHPWLKEGTLLASEAGGGSTVLLGMRKGRVFHTHSYKLGSYRLREVMEAMHASESKQIETLENEIETSMRLLRKTAGKSPGDVRLLLMGGDIRFAARHILHCTGLHDLIELNTRELEEFTRHIIHRGTHSISSEYGLAPEEARTLGPALKIYSRMARKLSLDSVLICGVTLRDGLMAEAATGSGWTDDFVEQVLHSAEETGFRYGFDAEHARCVTENALSLFNALQEEHKLQRRERILLKVAAMLHDTGTFISSQKHHKHSAYLIRNSEIFGLGERDLLLISLIARYHRKAMPMDAHEDYCTLSREEKLTVSRLAGILRVADALDRSHMQFIRNPVVRPEKEAVLIFSGKCGLNTGESTAVEKKGDLFRKVFGRPAVLVQGGG